MLHNINKLKKRKHELLNNLEQSRNYKSKTIKFVHDLEYKLSTKKISLYEFKYKLNKVLKNKELNDWVNYYNERIDSSNKELILLNEEIKSLESTKTSSVSLLLILGLILMSISALVFLKPQITGLVIYNPGEIINDTLTLTIPENITINESIVKVNLNSQQSQLPLDNFNILQNLVTIDLSKFNLITENGTLNAQVIFDNNIIAETSLLIEIQNQVAQPSQPNENVTIPEINITLPENITTPTPQENITPSAKQELGLLFSVSPQDQRPIGYEYLDSSRNVVPESSASIIHIWNNKADYYFNKTSGIQWTEDFNKYWTKNIFCGGFFSTQWNWGCVDSLPFNLTILTDNQTYVNLSLSRTIVINANRRLNATLTYSLNQDAEEILINPRLKNVGTQSIPNNLGVIWRVQDIKINNNPENDQIEIPVNLSLQDDVFNLNQTLNLKYYKIQGNNYRLADSYSGSFIKIRWLPDQNFSLNVVKEASFNSNVNLTINFTGSLAINAERTTDLFWQDPAYDGTAINGGTFGNDATIGTNAWGSPSNAQLSDNAYASWSSDVADTSQYLNVTNFGFKIPAQATIVGIQVDIERKCSANGATEYCRDNGLKLIQSGVISGTDKADTTTKHPTADAYVSYGNYADTWGLTFTPAQINNANFGVVYSSQVNSGTPIVTSSVDHIRMTVYYTLNQADVNNGNVFVQTGQTVLAGTTRSAVEIVSRVENNTAFLLYTKEGPTVDPATGQVIVFLQNQTLINVSRTGSATAANINVTWYLINMSGIQVTRGKFRGAGTVFNQKNITIPGINTTGAFLTVTPGLAGAGYGSDDIIMTRIVNYTQIQFSVSSGDDFGGTSNEYEWQLINATNGNFRTQQVFVDFGMTQQIANVSLLTPVNLSKSFIMSSHKQQSTIINLDGQSRIVPYFFNNTNIQINRTAFHNANLNVSLFVVEFADSSTVQSGVFNMSQSQTQANVTLTNQVNLTSSVAFLSSFMTQGTSNYSATDESGVARFQADLNTTSVKFTRALTQTSNSSFAWFVVQFNTSFAPPATAANNPPIIGNVTLDMASPVALTEAGNKSFLFSFVATDADGAGNLVNNSAVANVTAIGETTRYNDTFVNTNDGGCKATNPVGLNGINYSCTINLVFYDAATTWNISVMINDTNGAFAQNNTQTFVIQELTAIQLDQSSISFPTISINKNNISSLLNITITNTGNDDISGREATGETINITGITLVPSTGNTFIPASNFTIGEVNASTGFNGDYCDPSIFKNVTRLQNKTDAQGYSNFSGAINGSSLLAQASENKKVFGICLIHSPNDLQSGTIYSTSSSGSWTIAIFYFKRKNKLYQKNKKLINTIIELKINGKLDDKNLISLINYEKLILTPISIFKNSSPLESLVKYLKDNLSLSLSEIASLLNRDQRTIWVTYNNVNKKKLTLDISSNIIIPINLFSNRKLSILENLSYYLYNERISLKKISILLNRNYKTIYTVYQRALIKLHIKEVNPKS